MRAFDAEWIGMFRQIRSCGMGWATSWQRCFERRPALLKGYCRLKGKAPASVICLSPYLAAGLDFCCSCLDNSSTIRPRRCVPSFPGNPDNVSQMARSFSTACHFLPTLKPFLQASATHKHQRSRQPSRRRQPFVSATHPKDSRRGKHPRPLRTDSLFESPSTVTTHPH